MISLMVSISVAISCFFSGLVSGTWMAVWVCGLTLLAGVITSSFFNLQWLMLSLVYVGGVFVLLLYVGGMGSSSNSGSGLVLVFLAVMIWGFLSLASSGYGVEMESPTLSHGGIIVALSTIPIMGWVLVSLNWVLYGVSGAFRAFSCISL